MLLNLNYTSLKNYPLLEKRDTKIGKDNPSEPPDMDEARTEAQRRFLEKQYKGEEVTLEDLGNMLFTGAMPPETLDTLQHAITSRKPDSNNQN